MQSIYVTRRREVSHKDLIIFRHYLILTMNTDSKLPFSSAYILSTCSLWKNDLMLVKGLISTSWTFPNLHKEKCP